MSSTTYLPHNQQNPENPSQYPIPANDPTVTNYALNLTVLQRYLPSTVSIVFLAPYAVVYIYNITTNAWEKSGIEGTLFVVQLQDEKYAVVVLNRRGLENFILHLKSEEEVDVTGEYVILEEKGGGGSGGGNEDGKKVYGLWVFEEELGSTKGVRDACARCIVECARRSGMTRGIGVGDGQSNGYAQQSDAGAPSGVDLMALLDPSRRQGAA